MEATVRIQEGERVRQQTQRWGTMTADIEALADWLTAQGVTQVGMESTGVFWKPIYNILEGRLTVIWVNARHLKQVPGRKSDIRDSQWGAQLLQCGLLRGSFIPPRWQRPWCRPPGRLNSAATFLIVSSPSAKPVTT